MYYTGYGIQKVAFISVSCALLLASGNVYAQATETASKTQQSEAKQESQQKIEDKDFLLDDVRTGIENTVSASAAWVDSFFAEQVDPADYEDVRGKLVVTPEWDEYGGIEVDSSFRAQVVLPHAKRQFSAIIGRGDFDDFINEQQTQRPTVIRRNDADEDWMVGLGFDPRVEDGHDISYGAGFRGGINLDPYVRARYRYETIISQRSELHWQTVGFWRDSDGFGVSQTIDHDYKLTETWFNKFWIRGTFAERTEGIRWHATNTLYYVYHQERALGTEIWWYGETRHEIPIHDYGARFLHRARFLRDWFYVEAWVGLHWPREMLTEPRKPRWLAGIEFELQFGN